MLQFVLRCAFTQAAIGLALGIPAAIFAGHAIASQLFGVKPDKVTILLLTTLTLSLAATVVALVAAGCAASFKPGKALRTE